MIIIHYGTLSSVFPLVLLFEAKRWGLFRASSGLSESFIFARALKVFCCLLMQLLNILTIF